MRLMMREKLERFLRPRSIAVVGASPDVMRIGGRPIAYSLAAGYSGRIYPINPHYDEIQGLRAYPRLESVPAPIDLVVVAVSQKAVEGVIDGAPLETAGFVVFTAGYKEMGGAGEVAEDRLRTLVEGRGSILLGPNCLGFVNPFDKVFATFSSGFEGIQVRPGPIAIITQSGAFGAYLFRLAVERDLGVGFWVSTGNEAGESVSDWITYGANDPNTAVIVAYMEGVRDSDGFRRALDQVDAAQKTLIVIKAGQSQRGALAAMSHTGSVVGSDQAFDAALRYHRAIRVDSIRDMLDLAEAAMLGSFPQGNRLGIITISGGAGILMADAAYKAGLDVPKTPDSVSRQIRTRVPFAAPDNPVDFTAQMINEPGLLEYSLNLMVETRQFDAMAIFLSHVIAAPSLMEVVLNALRHVRHQTRMPLYLVGLPTAEIRRQLRELGTVLIEDATLGIRLIARLAALPSLGNKKEIYDESALEPESGQWKGFTEYDIKQWLRNYHILIPRGYRVTSATDAMQKAERLGYPVVMKLQSPTLMHKTDIHALSFNVASAQAVETEFNRLMRLGTDRAFPELSILLEEMIEPGVEILVSVRQDPVFGPLLVYGLGGIWAEIFHDLRTELVGVSPAMVYDGLMSLQSAPILRGARGQGMNDLRRAGEVIARIGNLGAHLIQTGMITELELNPVRLTSQGPVVLDAAIYRSPHRAL